MASPTPTAAPRRRRRGLWPLRLLLRLLFAVAVLAVVLVAATVCFALFPPTELLRRAALPIAQRLLHHDNLHIGRLILHPLDGVELRDVWLGPPAGYAKPLFTVQRIVVRYDLSRIGKGEIHVRAVQVERPLVRVEARRGKLNWLAFLEGLPKSEPTPKKESEPSDLRIWVDRVSVIGFAASFDDGRRRAVLDSLHIALCGLYSRGRSHFDVALRFEGPLADRPSLALLQRGAQALGGRFNTRLAIDVAVDQVQTPRATLALDLDVASTELRSPWHVDPVHLATRIRARADLPAERAELQQLAVSFNGTELVRLSAALDGLTTPRQVELLLQQLHLPLTRLAPYARAFVKGIDFGGDVKVRELRVAGPVAALKEKQLPKLEGTLELQEIWATMERQHLQLRGLDATIAFASRQQGQPVAQTPQEILHALPALGAAVRPSALDGVGTAPPLGVQGRIRIGRVRAASNEVRGLELRLASGVVLHGTAPTVFGSRISLAIPTLRMVHAKLGTLQLGLRTQLQVGGDLSRRSVDLQRLDLAVDDWLQTQVSASAEDFGKRSFRADVDVKPLDLAVVLRRLPPALRAPLGAAKLAGAVGLRLRVRGRSPGPRTPPLQLPVELDARIALQGVTVQDSQRALALGGVDGEITAKGKPSDLLLTTALRVASVSKPDQRVSLKDVRLPVRVHLTPTRLEAQLGADLGQARAAAAGVVGQGLKTSATIDLALPMASLIAGQPIAVGKTSVQLRQAWQSLRLTQPGNAITIGKHQTTIDVSYDPTRVELTRVGVRSTIDALSHAQVGASLGGLGFELQTALGGPRLTLPLKLRPEDQTTRGLLRLVRRVPLNVKVQLARFGMRQLLEPPLRQSRVELAAAVGADEKLTLQRLLVRLPTRGVQLDASGTVDQLLTVGPGGGLPPFDLSLKAGLDNPVTRDPGRATFLYSNVKGAGQVAVAARVRRITPQRVQLDGRLLARNFNVWLRGLATETQGGNVLRKTTVIHVRDMNAEVPISQQVILRPAFGLPKPKRSVFETQSASVLYGAMQPYVGSRSRLSIGGVALDERLTVMTREGYFLSTVKRRLAIDRIALDMGIADSTLRLSRLYLKLFGGDIAGEVQAQLLDLARGDIRLRLPIQITGVNLAYLDRDAKERTAKTEISALADIKFSKCAQHLEGRVDITRLSLDMLDSLLAYLDPSKTNESVQNNRKLLKAWYIKLVNPKVQLVSVWISHQNLNMDIEMDAWFVAGMLIKRTLKNMRIRRINILPFLPRCEVER
jgi:hypothetical protein